MAIVITLIIVLAVVLGVVLGLAAARPAAFQVKRSTLINAPAARIFPLIDDFHQWTKWSPWENMDADLNRTYAGPDRGRGAAYAWEGRKSGSGAMEITDSRDPDLLVIRLEFLKPMKATNTVEFTVAEADGKSQVDWVMYGQMPLMHRAVDMVMPMDKLVGGQFAQGLAKLKAVAEA